MQPAPEVSDETIVARVCAGETQLFEALMRRYNQRVYRAARAVLRDDREAEEATQEAWLNAFAHLGSFAGRARFSTWLTRIAINQAIERARVRKRGDALRTELGRVAMPASHSAEQSVLDDEVRHALEEAIERLPQSYRMTFMLREVDGMSTAETAESLDVAQDTVKTRVHRARALLRRDLEGRFGDALRDTFGFGFARCDRVVAAVLAAIAAPPDGTARGRAAHSL